MERPRVALLGLLAALIVPVPSLPQGAPRGLVPLREVPDTRGLGLLVTADVITETLRVFGRWYPREGAVCYYGGIRDAQVVPERVLPAQVDSSSLGRVWFAPSGPLAGCADSAGGLPLVATAHSHTFGCERLSESISPEDVALLAADRRQLLMMVYCLATGRALVLFGGDPRRVEFAFIERRERP
jgi:hypothetical protein